jgi:hypothetical protein
MEKIPLMMFRSRLRNSSLLWYLNCSHIARQRTEASSWSSVSSRSMLPLRLPSPGCLAQFMFPVQHFYAFCVPLKLAALSARLIFLYLVTLRIFNGKYKLWSCKVPHTTHNFLSPELRYSRHHFLLTPAGYESFLWARVLISHPYKIMGKIINLYVLIFTFL